MSHKFDLGCILTGVVTSQFFSDAFEKTIITTFSMLIATTIAFFWRRYLHRKMRERLKNKNKKENNG